jgi:ABC-2 type transport system ATP-binding protein
VQVACDRVLIISKGRIVADDTPDGLRERAGKARYVAGVLDSGNGASDKVESALRNVAGVERVRKLESEPGELRFELLPKSEEDIRPAVFRAAIEQQLTLIELQREGQNLEQIFRELTTAGTPGKAAAASAPAQPSAS